MKKLNEKKGINITIILISILAIMLLFASIKTGTFAYANGNNI